MRQEYISSRSSCIVRHQTQIGLDIELKPKPFQDAVNRLLKSGHPIEIEKMNDSSKSYIITYIGEDEFREAVMRRIEEVEKAVMEAVQMRLALELVEENALDKLISNMI